MELACVSLRRGVPRFERRAVFQAKRSGRLRLVFAKTFVTEPAAVLVRGREIFIPAVLVSSKIVLLEVASRHGRNHAVTFVRSLNGRDDLLGVLRVEPIDVLVLHAIPHN